MWLEYTGPMFLPIFEKRGNYAVLNSASYLVTYHWERLLTRIIIYLRKGVYDIPDENGGLSKWTRLGLYITETASKGYYFHCIVNKLETPKVTFKHTVVLSVTCELFPV